MQVTDTVVARKLGYYIFWNLRQENSGLAVAESEVREAALRAGIKHPSAAWELFDRNCDRSATLEEIVESVEQVFQNRDSLLHTLKDNETVVAQVEYAIGVTLFIVWLFIAAAIFDAGAVQRTWTALSAGLLSFSFIFGNSIREVRSAAPAAALLLLRPSDFLVHSSLHLWWQYAGYFLRSSNIQMHTRAINYISCK